jgi:hypothetical protein
MLYKNTEYFRRILASALFSLIIVSCGEGNKVTGIEEKYAKFDSASSVIPQRLEFGKDNFYYFRLSIPSNYSKEENFTVKALLSFATHSLEMQIFDDGVSDGQYRDDIAASNNVWTGAVNGRDFSEEGDWRLNIGFYLNDSINIGSDSFSPIYVVRNSLPLIGEVTGIESSSIFVSGFETKNISVAVADSNNAVPPYDSQILTSQLFNSTGVKLKENTYTRTNNNSNFLFQIDSTYASGINGGRGFKIVMTATDLYGGSDFKEFTNIRIDNTAPSLYNLMYPDTVFIPQQDSIYFSVTVNANDPQGHLEYQDIKQVVINLNGFDFFMRDDGNENFYPYNSGDVLKNDGIYTATFKVKSTNNENLYPFSVLATDKADNVSPAVSGTLTFVKNLKKNAMKGNDENNYNYASPFKP